MSVLNRAVNWLYSGSVSNQMFLRVKHCTLSGTKIQSVVAFSLILEAVEGVCTCMNWILLGRVRLDMKVVVVVSRFSRGLACMRHVIMTLWVWVQVAPHFLPVSHALCCHSSVYYVSKNLVRNAIKGAESEECFDCWAEAAKTRVFFFPETSCHAEDL